MIIKKFVSAASIFLIAVITVVLSLIGYLAYPFSRKTNVFDFLTILWTKLLLKTRGIKVTVEGLENLEEGISYVFVANHQSLFDIPACFYAIPRKLRMLAKKELFRIPVFGWSMAMIGHIVIDRENREKAVKSVDEAAERLRTEDICPVIFPEGTRSADGKIHKFKKGAFVLAIKAERDIVPVTIIGSRGVLPKKTWVISSGHIHVVIDKPVETKGMDYKKRDELAKQIQEVIENRFHSYSKDEES
ncbi:MAG: 1-acyl-sn-glycerol-3-phosphate acyltransferase [bacterium]|nr:1-acyl-sn-glycerol-3-phosphate acyltransferase [bacterium]